MSMEYPGISAYASRHDRRDELRQQSASISLPSRKATRFVAPAQSVRHASDLIIALPFFLISRIWTHRLRKCELGPALESANREIQAALKLLNEEEEKTRQDITAASQATADAQAAKEQAEALLEILRARQRCLVKQLFDKTKELRNAEPDYKSLKDQLESARTA